MQEWLEVLCHLHESEGRSDDPLGHFTVEGSHDFAQGCVKTVCIRVCGEPFPMTRQQGRPPISLLLEVADERKRIGDGRRDESLPEIAQEGLHRLLPSDVNPKKP